MYRKNWVKKEGAERERERERKTEKIERILRIRTNIYPSPPSHSPSHGHVRKAAAPKSLREMCVSFPRERKNRGKYSLPLEKLLDRKQTSILNGSSYDYRRRRERSGCREAAASARAQSWKRVGNGAKLTLRTRVFHFTCETAYEGDGDGVLATNARKMNRLGRSIPLTSGPLSSLTSS